MRVFGRMLGEIYSFGTCFLSTLGSWGCSGFLSEYATDWYQVGIGIPITSTRFMRIRRSRSNSGGGESQTDSGTVLRVNVFMGGTGNLPAPGSMCDRKHIKKSG